MSNMGNRTQSGRRPPKPSETVTKFHKPGGFAKMKKKGALALRWLVVAVAIAALMAFALWAGAEWSEAIVQAIAAIGGLLYWLSRSRPRVTLRLISSGGLYLELLNVGNRVAKGVVVSCDPPIRYKDTLGRDSLASRETFGPFEDFGDMDRNQRYVVMVGTPGRAVETLEKTTFEVSHERPWGFRRRKATFRFGGSGWRTTLGEGTATTMGDIATTVKKYEQKLEEIGRAIKTVSHRLLPPEQGGEDIDLKSCAACGWKWFTYHGNYGPMFLCANCGETYEITADCECKGMWCEHSPSPPQCTRGF